MVATSPVRADSRASRSRWIVGIGLAAVATLAAAWFVASGSMSAGVKVLLTAGALSCDGANVTLEEVPSRYGDDVIAPVAAIAEEMRCTLDVRIENRSRSSVTVEQVFLPVLGPETGAGVRAVVLAPVAIEPEPGGVDAIFNFDHAHPIPAGSADTFGVIMEWQPVGCTSDGGTLTFSDQPTVTVSVWGRRHEAAFIGTGFGFRGSAASSCDE